MAMRETSIFHLRLIVIAYDQLQLVSHAWEHIQQILGAAGPKACEAEI